MIKKQHPNQSLCVFNDPIPTMVADQTGPTLPFPFISLTETYTTFTSGRRAGGSKLWFLKTFDVCFDVFGLNLLQNVITLINS